MTPDELRSLLSKATPGPWHADELSRPADGGAEALGNVLIVNKPPKWVKGELRKRLLAHEPWPNAPLHQRIAHALCDENGQLISEYVGDLHEALRAEGLEIVEANHD